MSFVYYKGIRIPDEALCKTAAKKVDTKTGVTTENKEAVFKIPFTVIHVMVCKSKYEQVAMV